MKKIKKLLSMLFVVVILTSSTVEPAFALEGGQWQSGSAPTFSLASPFYWNQTTTTSYPTAFDAYEQIETTLTVEANGGVTFGGKMFNLGLKAGVQVRCRVQRERHDVFRYVHDHYQAYNLITNAPADWFQTFDRVIKTWYGHTYTEWRLTVL